MDGKEATERLPQVVDRGALEAVVFALHLYMDQDECVCEAQPCPDDCGQCMYCIAYGALEQIGEAPDVEQELTAACREAEDWLSEFCDDQTDEGVQGLLSKLRTVLKRIDKRPKKNGPVVL